MRTRKKLGKNPQNGNETAQRVCVRDRAVVFKESEAEEFIPSESIPLIEEIMADLLFAAWVSERGCPSNSTQMEERNDEPNLTETNLSA